MLSVHSLLDVYHNELILHKVSKIHNLVLLQCKLAYNCIDWSNVWSLLFYAKMLQVPKVILSGIYYIYEIS